MSKKTIIENPRYVQAGDPGADGAATFNFPTITALQVDKMSFEIVNTGCNGTMQFQESNSGVEWKDTSSNSSNTSGLTQIGSMDVVTKYVRCRFVRTSGSGLLTIAIVGKSVG